MQQKPRLGKYDWAYADKDGNGQVSHQEFTEIVTNGLKQRDANDVDYAAFKEQSKQLVHDAK